MSCRACKTCELRVPHTVELCPACGDETSFEHHLEPDVDWEFKAASYVSPKARAMILWRRKRFVEVGFAGAVLDMLVESRVDPHDAADLVAHGCPLDVAARILF